MSRRKARETAFKMLFQMDVGKNDLKTAEHTLRDSGLSGGYRKFALDLVNGVRDNHYELREYLAKFTKGWQVDRLAAVDRNLTELAMYEMKFTDVPANIVINEAVELAKIYGSSESPSFINALLDAFYRKVIVENNSDYQIDEDLKAKYLQEMAAAKQRAAMMREAEEAARAEERAAAEAQAAAQAAAKASAYAEENQIIKKQGFRKIKKANISEKEQIKAESVLEDKKRIYGEGAFLTERDLRKALENGETIPEEALNEYFKSSGGGGKVNIRRDEKRDNYNDKKYVKKFDKKDNE